MEKINLLSHLNKKDNFFALHWTIIIIICLGFYVRFIDLATHFSHCDDNGVAISIIKAQKSFNINYIRLQLEEKKTDGKRIFLRELDHLGLLEPFISIINKLKLEKFVIVPATWTYAPLQYLITPLLISDRMSYREILLWGRLPSFTFSILAFLALILVYKKFKGDKYFPYLIFSLALITFSWENIIYAKQMSSYSIGVLSSILILLLLLNYLDSYDFSLKKLLTSSLFLAILSHAQYQIFTFIPAFYLTLFLSSYSKTNQKITLIRNFILSIIFYLTLVSPLYYLFLRSNLNRGVSWLSNTQFILSTNATNSWIENFLNLISFYLKNSLIIIQANFAFLPEAHAFFKFLGYLLITLILLGTLGLFTTKSIKEKYTGLFFFILAITWAFLAYQKKIALSPTRHSLILLPYMSIIASEGLGFVTRQIKNLIHKNSLHTIASLTLSAFITFFFFSCFEKTTQERQDPFNEKEIYTLCKKYKINTVISYGATTNLGIMFQQKKYPGITFKVMIVKKG